MGRKTNIPIGVSARHIHLSEAHITEIFGEGETLTFDFDLSQPEQFAAKERITIKTQVGEISAVRILGPARPETQVEISKTDSFILGIKPPTRLSGDVGGSASVTLVGPKGEVTIEQGCIVAQAHIHMHPDDAKAFEVVDGEFVDVYVPSDRPITFHNVIIRVSPKFKLDMHIDTDEGNAGAVTQGMIGTVIKK
jgi:putative phosphotransacetylase